MRGIEGLELVDEEPVAPFAAPATERLPVVPSLPDRALEQDEHAARRTLRRQVARLEQQLSIAVADDLLAGARGRLQTDVLAAPAGVARLQSLGELERRRDELVARLTEVEARRTEELHNRVLLREMYRDPAAYKHTRLETSDLAERGCRVYEVVPRFGLVGILGGWWRVKVSSGCPLAPAASSFAGDEARHTDGRPRAARPVSGVGLSPGAGGRRTRGRAWRRSSPAGRGRPARGAARGPRGCGSTGGSGPGRA